MGFQTGCGQQKSSLRLVELAGDALNGRVVESLGVRHDRERIAAERLVGEHVDDGEGKTRSGPLSLSHSALLGPRSWIEAGFEGNPVRIPEVGRAAPTPRPEIVVVPVG